MFSLKSQTVHSLKWYYRNLPELWSMKCFPLILHIIFITDNIIYRCCYIQYVISFFVELAKKKSNKTQLIEKINMNSSFVRRKAWLASHHRSLLWQNTNKYESESESEKHSAKTTKTTSTTTKQRTKILHLCNGWKQTALKEWNRASGAAVSPLAFTDHLTSWVVLNASIAASYPSWISASLDIKICFI